MRIVGLAMYMVSHGHKIIKNNMKRWNHDIFRYFYKRERNIIMDLNSLENCLENNTKTLDIDMEEKDPFSKFT